MLCEAEEPMMWNAVVGTCMLCEAEEPMMWGAVVSTCMLCEAEEPMCVRVPRQEHTVIPCAHRADRAKEEKEPSIDRVRHQHRWRCKGAVTGARCQGAVTGVDAAADVQSTMV